MIYKLDWTFKAESSYYEEIEYIYLKWNIREVCKFEDLVSTELSRLIQNPTIGRIMDNKYSLNISKQTTLYYRINEREKSIELLLFWNNQKNPEELNKLL